MGLVGAQRRIFWASTLETSNKQSHAMTCHLETTEDIITSQYIGCCFIES